MSAYPLNVRCPRCGGIVIKHCTGLQASTACDLVRCVRTTCGVIATLDGKRVSEPNG